MGLPIESPNSSRQSNHNIDIEPCSNIRNISTHSNIGLENISSSSRSTLRRTGRLVPHSFETTSSSMVPAALVFRTLINEQPTLTNHHGMNENSNGFDIISSSTISTDPIASVSSTSFSSSSTTTSLQITTSTTIDAPISSTISDSEQHEHDINYLQMRFPYLPRHILESHAPIVESFPEFVISNASSPSSSFQVSSMNSDENYVAVPQGNNADSQSTRPLTTNTILPIRRTFNDTDYPDILNHLIRQRRVMREQLIRRERATIRTQANRDRGRDAMTVSSNEG